MFGFNVSVTSKDNRLVLDGIIKDLKHLQVYVGIPEERAPRKQDEEISNAQLCFIHTSGSPLRKIPARPIIEPAIEEEEHKRNIAETLGEACQATFNQQKTAAKQKMRLAGQQAVNYIRAWFTDPRNGWAPNSEGTIRRKIEKLQGKKGKLAIEALDWGQTSFMYDGEEISLNTPLIDTGQLQKAMTYVLEGEENA